MQKNNNNVGSFDEVLNSLYGEPGTPQREEFRREAYAYCAEDEPTDTRKCEGMALLRKPTEIYANI